MSDSSESRGTKISAVISKLLSQTLAIVAFKDSQDGEKWLSRLMSKKDAEAEEKLVPEDNPLTRMIKEQAPTLGEKFGMKEEEIVEKSVQIWKCLSPGYQKLYQKMEDKKLKEEEEFFMG